MIQLNMTPSSDLGIEYRRPNRTPVLDCIVQELGAGQEMMRERVEE